MHIYMPIDDLADLLYSTYDFTRLDRAEVVRQATTAITGKGYRLVATSKEAELSCKYYFDPKQNLNIFACAGLHKSADFGNLARMFFTGNSPQAQALVNLVNKSMPGHRLFVGHSMGGFYSIHGANSCGGKFIAINAAYSHIYNLWLRLKPKDGLNLLTESDSVTGSTRPSLPGTKIYILGTTGHLCDSIFDKLAGQRIVLTDEVAPYLLPSTRP